MAVNRPHACVYFDDDGWLELVCSCGQRAVYLPDEDGGDGALVLLDECSDDAAVAGTLQHELAVSA
ncbi:hypothetical protein [Cellulomonas fimi]|uniref:Uncharacterized protein n=1 Tax=Cellulomonas fimi TaxID=1708 RepID=A0A7Y0M069_CELFI|nr:hypothetical protein [Cellulomonas fimi]NMR21171.1 hypothetical protein [Cellulomonas fimi]